MKKQLASFKNALFGVWSVVKSEPHMRFHIAAAFYALAFAPFYGFTAGQLAVIFTVIAFVFSAEILNTCIERLCDFVCGRYDRSLKVIKDAAAGVVLVAAAAAAAVGVIFYFDTRVIGEIIGFLAANPLMLASLAASALFFVLFVWLGPLGIKRAVLRILNRRKA